MNEQARLRLEARLASVTPSHQYPLGVTMSLARRMKVNPEDALRVAGQRFRDRFAAMQSQLAEEGKSFRDLDASQLTERWDRTH